MESFAYRAGQFCCEEVAVKSIAQDFGTPTYVYSQAAILRNFDRVRNGLARIRSLICYSVKANSNLRILGLLREAGAGFDIVSGGELARVCRAGADPQRVVFSGVGKTEPEIDAGLNAGILMFNVESAGELDLIERCAQHLRKSAGISIRINPDIEAETHPYVSTGRAIHKFGVPKEDGIELYRHARQSESLRIRGIACHIGSQILDAEPFLKALDEVLDVAKQLASEGIEVEFLDLGGGYGIRYAKEKPLDFEGLTQELSARLQGTPYRLILEPGRSLVGDAGILLTCVLDVKRNQQKNFVVVDAGMNDLIRPSLYGSHHEIALAELCPESKVGFEEKIRADVVGPLCETADFLAQNRELPNVSRGDLLAVLTVGAYGYVLASNYNSRPRPAEVLVHGTKVELIRQRERMEDLMRGEIS